MFVVRDGVPLTRHCVRRGVTKYPTYEGMRVLYVRYERILACRRERATPRL
jgi:hypothetical protein